MKLTEYRGKELLSKCGIDIPEGTLLGRSGKNDTSNLELPAMVKGQSVTSRRNKLGLIQKATTEAELKTAVDKVFSIEVDKAPVDSVLVEQLIDFKIEYYLAILYSTDHQAPILMLSKEGGVDIEEQTETIAIEVIDITTGPTDDQLTDLLNKSGIKNDNLKCFLEASWNCFEKYDCRILEINPIMETDGGNLIAGDCKITIDDSALSRQEISEDDKKTAYTPREIAARKIDEVDYRGVAGKTYSDLDGDIAVMASGGGASLTCMDALILSGLKPANYVEYSGNPPKDKVYALSKVVLSIPDLKGCIIIGGTANFTDIFETLSGVMEAIGDMKDKPTYPIVIRRAGPRDKEAFEMIEKFAKQHDLDITCYDESTPMTKAVQLFAEKVS